MWGSHSRWHMLTHGHNKACVNPVKIERPWQATHMLPTKPEEKSSAEAFMQPNTSTPRGKEEPEGFFLFNTI